MYMYMYMLYNKQLHGLFFQARIQYIYQALSTVVLSLPSLVMEQETQDLPKIVPNLCSTLTVFFVQNSFFENPRHNKHKRVYRQVGSIFPSAHKDPHGLADRTVFFTGSPVIYPESREPQHLGHRKAVTNI